MRRLRQVSIFMISLASLLFISSAQAVNGGQFLPGASFLWIVAVEDDDYLCSGSMINAQWVLTARHCTQGENTRVKVLDYPEDFDFSGFQNQRNLVSAFSPRDLTEETKKKFVIESQVVSEIYDSETEDLALMRLESPLTKVSIFPEIVTPKEALSIHYRGDKRVEVVLAGFGRNTLPDSADFTQLLFRLYYYTTLEPESLWVRMDSKVTEGYVSRAGFRPPRDENSFSADYEYLEAIIAGGDSGGPLLTSIQGKWKIIGVNVRVTPNMLDEIYHKFRGSVPVATFARSVKLDMHLCALIKKTGGQLSIKGYEACNLP